MRLARVNKRQPAAEARAARIHSRYIQVTYQKKENRMAVNAYLYVEGVEGPSTSKPNHIDVLSFSWGVSQTSTYGPGQSGKEAKAGRADFSNLTIMKVLDKTSPLLCDHCASGDILTGVYLIYDKPVGDKQDDYFRVYLKDALITSVQLSGTNENPSEAVSFAFQAVEIAYRPETDDGELDGAIRKGYDLAALKPDFAAALALG
jgi:type VI secretion system secreted protein Hcp